MNVENTRLYVGSFNENSTNTVNGFNSRKNTVKVFSNSQDSQDKILQKRKEAREKAMDLVKGVFEAEKSIDDDLKERAERRDKAQRDIEDSLKGLKEIDEYKKELMGKYGVAEDSQEQADLKLLEKRRDSMKPDSDIVLTKEDKERLAQIDEAGMTEYQQLSLEADASGGIYRQTIKDSRKVILEENAIIRAIGLERLKSHPMADAKMQAEDIMASANKEIIGMIMDEGKDTVDEKMEEIKEEMEAAKEDKKEQEEYIEEIQQRNEELEAATEKRREENKKSDLVLPDVPVEQLLELDAIKTEVQQEVQNILSEMKMVAEDMKGSVVDTEL